MSDINNVTIVGNLTADPVVKVVGNDLKVCTFSIASNRTRMKDGQKEQQVSFINCTAWGKTGETIAQYLSKGQRIGIIGRLYQNRWETEDGQKRSMIQVMVEQFQFLSYRDPEKKQNVNDHERQQSFDDIPADNPFNDDDIPF